MDENQKTITNQKRDELRIKFANESLRWDANNRGGYELFVDGAFFGFDARNEEVAALSVKIQRTVDAAYHALLEMTAWMGIPDKKRSKQIEQYMENVKYCAEHDLRHIDESQAVMQLKAEVERLNERCKRLSINEFEALEKLENYRKARGKEPEPTFDLRRDEKL